MAKQNTYSSNETSFFILTILIAFFVGLLSKSEFTNHIYQKFPILFLTPYLIFLFIIIYLLIILTNEIFNVNVLRLKFYFEVFIFILLFIIAFNLIIFIFPYFLF